MLVWSAWILTAAAGGGMALIVLSQVAPRYVRVRWPGILHGSLGVAGSILLTLGLRGPARGAEQGAGSFGIIAAGMIGCAVLLGGLVFTARMRRQAPSTLAVGIHATLAVGGLVLLAAYVAA